MTSYHTPKGQGAGSVESRQTAEERSEEIRKKPVQPAPPSGSALTVVNGSRVEMDCARSEPLPVQGIFRDRKTKLIVKMIFYKLCPSCKKHHGQLQKEVIRLGSQDDVRQVRRVSHLITEFILETNQLNVNLEDFIQWKWQLHAGNMYTEFSRVAYETFKDATNWGRILMFIGFSVSFSLYLEQEKVAGATNSVLEWTCQVVEEDLGKYFLTNGGWEGFANYLEMSLRATKRSKQGSGEETSGANQSTSLWHGAFAAGAVAVGAMAALTLRQAFS